MRNSILLGVVALLLILTQVTNAQNACHGVYQAVVKSLDETFREMRGASEKEKASGIPGLLNRALAPMVKAFGDKVSQLSSQEIRKRLKDFQTYTPIYNGEYYLLKAQIPNAADTQKMLNHNASLALRVYALDKQDHLVRRLNEHVYVAYSETRLRDLGNFHKQLGSLVTPVGDYGREFAQDTLRTTQILMDYATHHLKKESEESFKSAPELLKEETTRGRAHLREKAMAELTPLSGMMEGIVTFHQLTSILLADKITGVSDGAEALRLLVKSGATKAGLASEITMQYPMGVVGPSSLAGFGIRNPLMLDRISGKLKTTSNMKSYLEYLQGKLAQHGTKKRVCPMAGLLRGLKPAAAEEAPSSGIQIVAEAYLKVFEEVRAERLRAR